MSDDCLEVGIRTYGCTLNQADSDIIRSVLTRSSVTVREGLADAEVAVINTCTVKKGTERKILHRLAELERQKKRMIVTGCMAGANRDLIERYAPSASIVTTANIPRMPEAVRAVHSGSRVVLDGKTDDRLGALGHPGGVIARIPVNDGCLSACSFCETRFARGPLHSFDEATILRAVRSAVERGAIEVQLTSQDMGAYGRDRKTALPIFSQRYSRSRDASRRG